MGFRIRSHLSSATLAAVTSVPDVIIGAVIIIIIIIIIIIMNVRLCVFGLSTPFSDKLLSHYAINVHLLSFGSVYF